jgi:hypothetical protein
VIWILQWWCTECNTLGFELLRVKGVKAPGPAEVQGLAEHAHHDRGLRDHSDFGSGWLDDLRSVKGKLREIRP